MASSPVGTPPRDAPGGTSNFFVAFRVLPPERREGIESVYGFCRQADDAVDLAEDPGSARLALGGVRDRLERVFAGDPAGEADRKLREAVLRFRLPRSPFDDLLEGVSWDLERRRYEDRADLRRYCYRVASTVGLLCVRIFGCRGDSCDAYAEELGIAMQWTNILRDVGVDLACDRVYLPRESLRAHGLVEGDLRSADPNSRARLAALIRAEASFARDRYAEAERLLPGNERPKVLAGEIMAGVYRRLLTRVEGAGDRVLDRRIRVSSLRRACIAGGLVLRRKLRPFRRAGV